MHPTCNSPHAMHPLRTSHAPPMHPAMHPTMQPRVHLGFALLPPRPPPSNPLPAFTRPYLKEPDNALMAQVLHDADLPLHALCLVGVGQALPVHHLRRRLTFRV
eukprot:349870-Chlamydomonas_euryale.AAC.2